ncbi:MAG: tetratricopeptide repeat protein [Elusimicrobia bacterium]|nr:tetratricopeptide repeat protein [Elusimicrobiota bacterium]
MKRTRQSLLTVLLFVCPLLFFTNLTRNPYVTQICLVNLALLAWTALYFLREGAALPRTPVDVPLAAWLGVCLLSWVVAYFGHAPFFRPAMVNEGLRNTMFLLINCGAAFYLGASLGREGTDEPSASLGGWAAFCLGWGLLWTAFPLMRGSGVAPADIWGHLWDGYGAFVWLAGLAAALWLTRQGRAGDFLHLVFATAFLSSVYGVFQYFNVEFIWPNVLNPYGGRSVSTFGNPNFMSSYDVIVLPAAVVCFVQSRGGKRALYGAVALAVEAALLCSLTRSSWIGALVGVGFLFLWPEFRRELSAAPRPCGLFFAAALAMALVWPSSSISSGYTPSVLGRLGEVGLILKPEAAYSPFHQRRLIWSCAWLMGRENPLTGKGWGLFELYYPFYQGCLLDAYDFYRNMRTHANNAHNEILEIWSQTGAAGLGVSAWLWLTFFWAVRPILRRGRPQDGLCLAAAAGVAGMLADNLLNVSLHFAVPGFTFWWAGGLAMGAASRGGGERRLPKAAAWVAAALALALAPYWVRTWGREAWYFAGFKLLRQSDQVPNMRPAAVRALEVSRAWGPPEVNALYELGNSYARSERYTDADRTYREALDANAGYDEIYYNIAALEGARLGRPASAVDFFRVSWAVNPLSPEIYNSLGNMYLQNPGKYGPDGIALLERAVHFYPANANHWNNLGYLYTLAKRYGDAEKAYTEALTIDPGLELTARNLAGLSAQTHRPPPRILAELRRLSELDALVAKRDFSDATLNLAVGLGAALPSVPKARFLLGSLLLIRGRQGDAVGHLEWVVARQPEHVVARLNLGQAYKLLGRREEAVAQFRAALGLDPGNAQAKQLLESLR